MPTYRNNATFNIQVVDIKGNTITVSPQQIFQSYKIYGSPMIKTSDEPYFAISSVDQTITSPGSVSGLLNSKTIRIFTTGSDIVVKANTSTNTNSFRLTNGTVVDISNDNEIESLYFTGTGTVTVVGII